MTWTPERRAAQSERIKQYIREDEIKNGPRKSLAQLKAEAGMLPKLAQEDKTLILKLVDLRDELKDTLETEQTEWERRKVDLLGQIHNLSNAKIAEKFECSISQIRTAIRYGDA